MRSQRTEPARHSPGITYLLVWLTGGPFYLYWLWRMMRDINKLAGKPRFQPGRLFLGALIYFLVYLSLLAWAFYHLMFGTSDITVPLILVSLTVLLMAFGWIVGLLVVNHRIASDVADLQRQKGLPSPVSPVAAAVLFFVMYINVLYLQTEMNRLFPQAVSGGAESDGR